MKDVFDRFLTALGLARTSEIADAAQFEAELRAITTSETERADIRRAGLTAAKLGATSQEVAAALTYWHRHSLRHQHDAHRITSYVNSILLDGDQP